MKVKTGLLGLVLAMFAAGPAFAGNVNINFGGSGPLGATQPFLSGAVVAYGYECSATDATTGGTLSNCMPNNLAEKMDGPTETGLGLMGEGNGENEIGFDSTDADFLLGLDVSGLLKLGATSMTLSFGSVQPGEAYAVLGYGFNPFTAGSFTLDNTNTKAFVGNDGTTTDQVFSSTFNLNTEDQFLVILSPCAFAENPADKQGPCGGNVLLGSLNSNVPTPEPGTLALFATGLLGLGFGMRRRFAFQRQ